MKKIGLGLGLLLFSILFKLCSSGLDILSLAIGLIGLMIVLYGAFSKSE